MRSSLESGLVEIWRRDINYQVNIWLTKFTKGNESPFNITRQQKVLDAWEMATNIFKVLHTEIVQNVLIGAIIYELCKHQYV